MWRDGGAQIQPELTNGALHEPETIGPNGMINRVEYIRLLIQALRRLGLTEAAEMLERDSVGSCSVVGCWSCRASSHRDAPAQHHAATGLSVACADLQGVQMQPDSVTKFQDSIYAGQWDAALRLLPGLGSETEALLQVSPLCVPDVFMTVKSP